MLAPALPPDEEDRLAALRSLELLDTPAEERFDRITRIAQRLFDVPIVLVSLVDQCRQWFKSAQGLGASETPRDISFCGHAIHAGKVFVVENALDDPRFADNPLVTGPPNIRFYAGAPLATAGGFRVGTLCLVDSKARAFPATDQRDLRDLAAWVENELTRHHLAQYRQIGSEQEAFLRAILNTVVEGIITIDQRGTVESFNAAAVSIFGYPPEEVIGHNIKRLMPEPYRREHDGYLTHFLETREPRVIGIGREVTGCRKDGSTFPMELAVNETVVSGRRFFTGIVRDISRRKAAEQQLNDTTSLQRAVLDGTSYSIISTAPDGTILTFNRAAEQMLGYTADEVIGKLTPAPFHNAQEVAERATALSEELGETITPGFEVLVTKARRKLADEWEWTYLRKDGSCLPVLLSVTALRDAAEQITGFLGIAYDISERKKIDRLKNEFVSTVSHELRTPLTSIRGSLGLIAGGVAGPIPPQAAKLIEIAHSNSERLVRLINDILDIEKIESGGMQFNLAVQPLRPLLLHAIEANNAYAEQLNVRIELRSGELDGRVRIDSDRMMQAITNLLSNAAKYSPPGGCVELALEKRGGVLRITVSDHGPGIPEEFQARIFQKFSQADSSDTRRKAGTGLGLAITRSLVKSMGGRIGYGTSAAGTTFWIDLPEITGNGISLGPNSSPPEHPGAPRRPRILHVDDDADILSVVAAITGELADFDHASDLQSASHLLATQQYDLIILDLTLPDGSGHKLLPIIDTLRPEPRVVVFSASDVRREDAGKFAACLVKSVTTNEDLLTIIKAQIER
jgi:PAS domain S-box-containing protein